MNSNILEYNDYATNEKYDYCYEWIHTAITTITKTLNIKEKYINLNIKAFEIGRKKVKLG